MVKVALTHTYFAILFLSLSSCLPHALTIYGSLLIYDTLLSTLSSLLQELLFSLLESLRLIFDSVRFGIEREDKYYICVVTKRHVLQSYSYTKGKHRNPNYIPAEKKNNICLVLRKDNRFIPDMVLT